MEAMFGIEQLFNSCLAWFYAIYQGGMKVFDWFATEITYTDDEMVNVLLEPFVGYTPFELSFGLMLGVVLFMSILKFVKGFISMG